MAPITRSKAKNLAITAQPAPRRRAPRLARAKGELIILDTLRGSATGTAGIVQATSPTPTKMADGAYLSAPATVLQALPATSRERYRVRRSTESAGGDAPGYDISLAAIDAAPSRRGAPNLDRLAELSGLELPMDAMVIAIAYGPMANEIDHGYAPLSPTPMCPPFLEQRSLPAVSTSPTKRNRALMRQHAEQIPLKVPSTSNSATMGTGLDNGLGGDTWFATLTQITDDGDRPVPAAPPRTQNSIAPSPFVAGVAAEYYRLKGTRKRQVRPEAEEPNKVVERRERRKERLHIEQQMQKLLRRKNRDIERWQQAKEAGVVPFNLEDILCDVCFEVLEDDRPHEHEQGFVPSMPWMSDQ